MAASRGWRGPMRIYDTASGQTKGGEGARVHPAARRRGDSVIDLRSLLACGRFGQSDLRHRTRTTGFGPGRDRRGPTRCGPGWQSRPVIRLICPIGLATRFSRTPREVEGVQQVVRSSVAAAKRRHVAAASEPTAGTADRLPAARGPRSDRQRGDARRADPAPPRVSRPDSR